MRLHRLSHRHPIPVNLRSLADEVQQLRLHRRVDSPPRQRGLRYAAAAFVDQPVLQQRHADARREFAAAVRFLLVRVGMEVATAKFVAGEHFAAAGQGLVELDDVAIPFVVAHRIRHAVGFQPRIELAPGGQFFPLGNVPLAQGHFEQWIRLVHRLDDVGQGQRGFRNGFERTGTGRNRFGSYGVFAVGRLNSIRRRKIQVLHRRLAVAIEIVRWRQQGLLATGQEDDETAQERCRGGSAAGKGLRRTEFNFAGRLVSQMAKVMPGKIEFCTSEPGRCAPERPDRSRFAECKRSPSLACFPTLLRQLGFLLVLLAFRRGRVLGNDRREAVQLTPDLVAQRDPAEHHPAVGSDALPQKSLGRPRVVVFLLQQQRNLPVPSSVASMEITWPPNVPTATEGQPANCTAGQPSNWTRTSCCFAGLNRTRHSTVPPLFIVSKGRDR